MFCTGKWLAIRMALAELLNYYLYANLGCCNEAFVVYVHDVIKITNGESCQNYSLNSVLG
jgi:hypothetical protein